MGLIDRCHVITDIEMTSLANCLRTKLSESNPYLWRTELFSALKRIPGADIETEAQKAIGGYWSKWIDTSYSSSTVTIGSYIKNANPLNLISLNGSSYIIPSVQFYEMSNLREINLAGCTEIGAGAFYSCENLVTVQLPNCSTMGSFAFAGCVTLSQISLPNLQTISDMTFMDNENLSELNLPKLSYIPSLAFANCYDLASIYLEACTGAGSGAFSGTKFESLTFNESFTSIVGYPFTDMQYLNVFEAARLSNISGVGTLAFPNCQQLTTVSVPYLDNTKITWVSYYQSINIGAYSSWNPTLSDSIVYQLRNLSIALHGSLGTSENYTISNLSHFTRLEELTINDHGSSNVLTIGPTTVMNSMPYLSKITINCNRIMFLSLNMNTECPLLQQVNTFGKININANSGTFNFVGYYSSTTGSSQYLLENVYLSEIAINVSNMTLSAKCGHCIARSTIISKLILNMPRMAIWPAGLTETDPFENTTIEEIYVPASLYDAYTSNASWSTYLESINGHFVSF